jgi:hypothetical protein
MCQYYCSLILYINVLYKPLFISQLGHYSRCNAAVRCCCRPLSVKASWHLTVQPRLLSSPCSRGSTLYVQEDRVWPMFLLMPAMTVMTDRTHAANTFVIQYHEGIDAARVVLPLTAGIYRRCTIVAGTCGVGRIWYHGVGWENLA